MKKLVLLALILSALAPAQAIAACRASQWPYARQQSREDFRALFEQLDRPLLIEYLFDELSAARKPGIADILSYYVIHTEVDPDLRGFYETMRSAAGLDDEPKHVRVLDLKEVCRIQAGVLRQKADRYPQSSSKTRKRTPGR